MTQANVSVSQGATATKHGAFGRHSYLVTRLFIGVLLFYAGISKVTAGESTVIASAWVVPQQIVAGWGLLECLLGIAVLRLRAASTLRRSLVLMFSLFLAFLFLEWQIGTERCPCLGESGTPIPWVIALDSIVILAICLHRRFWDQPTVLPAGLLGDVARGCCFAIPGLLLAGTAVFGSPTSAARYLSGQSILVSSSQRFVGNVQPGDQPVATFELSNMSTKPIKALGAKASCRCVAVDDLPIVIPPWETRAIRISLKAGQVAGLQRESAFLFFDDSASGLTLGVTALVRPNPYAVDAKLSGE